jgi:branched-subunit amino acid aminotransferase/4-amino-4-deoxychorismate lyase
MEPIVYLNGELMSADRAAVSVFNGGWLHGAGLFETMRAEHRRVFRLERHLQRLRASANRLLAPIPVGALPDAESVNRLLAKNELSNARIRLTVTAGDVRLETKPPNGGEDGAQPLTVCMTAAPLATQQSEVARRGLAVLITRFRQSPDDPLAGHKTVNYLPRLIALNEARQAGCDEALWFNPANSLAEGSISNVFTVTRGTLITPPLNTPVLPGIARGIILEECLAVGLTTCERAIAIDELLEADEVFLTNVIRGVTPVCRIERRVIGSGRPGPVTLELQENYRRLVREECEIDG